MEGVTDEKTDDETPNVGRRSRPTRKKTKSIRSGMADGSTDRRSLFFDAAQDDAANSAMQSTPNLIFKSSEPPSPRLTTTRPPRDKTNSVLVGIADGSKDRYADFFFNEKDEEDEGTHDSASSPNHAQAGQGKSDPEEMMGAKFRRKKAVSLPPGTDPCQAEIFYIDEHGAPHHKMYHSQKGVGCGDLARPDPPYGTSDNSDIPDVVQRKQPSQDLPDTRLVEKALPRSSHKEDSSDRKQGRSDSPIRNLSSSADKEKENRPTKPKVRFFGRLRRRNKVSS